MCTPLWKIPFIGRPRQRTKVYTPSEIYKNFIQETFSSAKFVDANLNNLNSYSLGLAGLDHFNNGYISEEILPLYLKKPQAQRLLEEKERSK